MSNWQKDRDKIIGLGEHSFHKSYYPELQAKVDELEASHSNLEAILNSMGDAVLIHDFDGNFQYGNRQALLLLQVTKDEIKNLSIADISAQNMDLNRIPEILSDANFYNSQALQWRVKQKDSRKEIDVQVTLSEISWLGSKSLVAVLRDFTERLKFEKELVAAKEKAEESDRLKSAFLANMSHEIRTPMNAIMGFASLLKKPTLSSESQEKYISLIEQGGQRMLSIINDIIDISKIEAGLIECSEENFNLNEQLVFMFNLFKPEAKAKGLEFSINLAFDDQHSDIVTDRDKFYAIISNLLKNAIKFTEVGDITMGYQIRKAENIIEFYIKDTGIGIAPDRQEAIFERFVQADIEDRMARQGAGLGLSISQAYANVLGGAIAVKSELHKGSQFTFSLPLSKLQNQVITSYEDDYVPYQRIHDLKILVVEDDYASEVLIQEMVDVYAKEILIARDGFEAVLIARENEDIDLVLLDMQLPKMTGFEVASTIRQFNQDLVIVAQTAYALSGDKQKAIQAGCNDYIAKPINLEVLDQILNRYF
jgi:PAS domain S-box-containing protein